MNKRNQFKLTATGVKPQSGTRRLLGRSLLATACALSLAFYGCSKGGKTPATAITPTDVNKPEVKAVVSALDSLVKANKGKGKGVITGFLTGEGKSIAQGLLKQASNAGGERRFLTKTEIPLTGATVLIFNALKPTTLPDAKLETDSNGSYQAVLPEGKYFGFAIYLDLETFQLVTASIPNMNPKADTVVHMDTATAIEDVTAPTVTGVYDASTANADGVFLVGSIPDKNAKINISFSEPMNRESAKKTVIKIGTIDTSNTSTSMILKDLVDTSKVTMTWSGDSKELTINISELATGVQYGVVIPVSLKDLAKNPLAKEFKATFITAEAKALADVPFALTSSMPEDKGTMKPIQNPSVSFNRPVEAFSVLKNAKIDPPVTGYFEISGARAVFIHKEPLTVGKTYSISFPVGVTDLASKPLASEASFSFTVKDFEGAAKNTTGKKQEVALAVEAAFDAYLSGDVGRFGAAFHQNFRMYNDDGGIKSKTEFLEGIGRDVGDKQVLAAGFMGPVFDNSADACKDGANANRWKVNAIGGTADDQIWVDAYVNPGQTPKAYTLKDMSVIPNSELTWDPTGPRFTYKGKKYGFGPDMTNFRGPVNMDNAKNDRRFMGEMLSKTSTVALEAIKLTTKETFNVDPNVLISGDTAFLAVKMITYTNYNRANFGDHNLNCKTALADTQFQLLKFILVNDGTKWLIVTIVSPPKDFNKADFEKSVSAGDFKVKTMLPIELIAPLDANAQGADGKITFKFKGVVSDSVGGYLVGVSEDGKFCFGRPPFGALIFVKASNTTGKEESFVMNSAAGIEGSNATVLLRRAQDLKLPGWERTMFENALTKVYDVATGFGGVYNWKVIAIRDTSAAQFLTNGFNPNRFYGESDFGKAKGYFACKNFPVGDKAFTDLQNNQQNFVNTQPIAQNNGFNDLDLDGVPDGIELKYGSDPKDRNSFPEFRVDTDGDGLADFLEAKLDPKGTDSLVTKKADAAGVKAEIAALAALTPKIIIHDMDGDGFPDDIEMMAGFNPNDPKNNPGTRARANAPIGVFAGKFQMGANTSTVSFKLYTDSTKALFVAYTVVVGKDTLVDTAKTAFNDIAGEVYIPVTLSKSGPDAGRALLMRGHYDANMSLLQGPIDMIPAVAKTSIAFGGGPYVGQFAASGRGEDVSRYIGGGTQGGVPGVGPVGPVNNMPMVISYRLPPTGVSEGSKLIFSNGTLTLINDFGDTIAVVANIGLRSQPDGSYQFNGEKVVRNNMAFSRTEVGGTLMLSGDNWILDGHIFQESDSNGIHKQIPGQINGKAAKADIKFEDGSKLPFPVPQFPAGAFGGWIAQDKTGSGFAAQPPVNTGMIQCDPAKGPCTTNPAPCVAGQPCNTPPPVNCDPAKGPCTMQPPAAQLPGTGPAPTSFARPLVSGLSNFKLFLEKNGSIANEYFFVALNGRVYKVKYDSTNVQASKSPMCGQITLNLEMLGMKDESDISKSAHLNDSMSLPTVKGSIFVAIEDQFAFGTPSRIEKIRDSYGDVHANVFVVEMRLVGADYGTGTMSCSNVGPVNPPVTNPPCDPVKGCVTGTPPPCDPTTQACTGTNPPPCDPAKGCVTGTMPPPCDPVKGCIAGTPPPCDPTTQVCTVTNPPVNPAPADTGKPPLYKGTIANAQTVVNMKASKVKVGTPSGPIDAAIDASTIRLEAGFVIANDSVNTTRIYIFLGDKMDPTKLFMDPAGNIMMMPKI